MNRPLAAGTLEKLPVSANRQSRETRLPNAAELRAQLPLDARLRQCVNGYRREICRVLHHQDDRILLVVGPCSLHDEQAALDYGKKLKALAAEMSGRFLIVMRAYLEKPRTTVGWKGLLYDPERTGQGDLKQGLERSRKLLLALSALGLPVATEALNPLMMDYLGDLVSWAAIGARTTESQIHREMVSGLPLPVGFKNGTDGDVSVAINAMKSAACSHHYLGVSQTGEPAMIVTAGNPNAHLVLRGGRDITNYDEVSIGAALAELQKAGVPDGIVVDCSHDNARKQEQRQADVAREVMAQRAQGNHRIKGLMLESFLAGGRQDDGDNLIYGCSITDPCLSWAQTAALIRSL